MMKLLFISALIISWAAASIFTSADNIAKDKGWNVPDKIWPIIFISWLIFPYYLIVRAILGKGSKEQNHQFLKDNYSFGESSLLYVAWIAQIASPLLVLYVTSWYYIFIIYGAGYLLASWTPIFFKSKLKTISATILIFIYLPVVYLLLS